MKYLRSLGPFYMAEDYHQDYYKKNPLRYQYYRWHSGRDQFLTAAWKEDKFAKFMETERQNMKMTTTKQPSAKSWWVQIKC